MIMLILILTPDVDADGFYGFGIKGVGWSAFSRDLDWHFRICCFYIDWTAWTRCP